MFGRPGRYLRPRGLQLLQDEPRQLERIVELLRVLVALLPGHPLGNLLHPAHRLEPGDARRSYARPDRRRTIQERSPLPACLVLLLPAAPVRPLRTAGRRGASGRPRPRRCEDEPAAQFLRRVRGLHRRRTGRHDRQQPPAAALHRTGRQGLRPGDTGHVHGTQKPRTAAGRQRPVQRQPGLRQRGQHGRQTPFFDPKRPRKVEQGRPGCKRCHRPGNFRPLQGVPHRRNARPLPVLPQRFPGELEQRGDDGPHQQRPQILGTVGFTPAVQRL